MNERERLRIQKATVIAQAVATVRRLTETKAPTAVQMHAVATLAKRVAPYTFGQGGHCVDELMLLLMDVVEATEELSKGGKVPETLEELEKRFKRLDGD